MIRATVRLAGLVLSTLLLAAAASAAAAERAPSPTVGSLGQKRSVGPDASLEGTLEVAKKPEGPAGPELKFEQFRAGIEVQLSGKRREEIASLRKLIKLSGGAADQDVPSYYYRLAELLWEESQYFFFEANRKDGEILARPRGNPGLARLQAEKADAEGQSRDMQQQSITLYKAIIAKHPKYERLDEVLFFLARNLLQRDRNDPEAMKAYRALIQKFPDSPYVPDAWMAFGEYYFERANKGDRNGNLKKALEAYQKAATYQESSVYGYALYKQGWVQYNLGHFSDALDLFRSVVFFGELPTSTIPANRKLALVREAKKDYVRTWPHVGSAEAAFEDFRRVGGEAGVRDMLKTLADLYWTDGRDRDAILVYHRLIQERPVAPDAPFFQSRIVTMAGRMGRKDLAVQQAHVFVKILTDYEASPGAREPANAKAVAEARSTAENTLRTLALRYHNEWKKSDDHAVAGFATSIYTDYLEVFGGSAAAYEMRFFHAELLYALARFAEAGDEYDRVVGIDVAAMEASGAARPGAPGAKAGKWFADALEGALFAHEEAAKGLPAVAAQTGKKVRVPFAPEREKLVRAYQRYVRWAPDGKLASKAAFRAAKLYYDHFVYGEAIDLFTKVALDHPEGAESDYAANLVLDAYNELGDWRNLNGWAKRFYANAPLLAAHPKLREDLPRVIEESNFKVIEEQERVKDWEAAAESYLSFVRDWPNTRLAPTALYNASVDYARAHRVERAMEIREQLLQRYPGNPLAPRVLYDNAEGFEAVADFERAAADYERYFQAWRLAQGPAGRGAKGGKPVKAAKPAATASPAAPAAPGTGSPSYDEKRANDAIINAAVFRAGLRQWAKAEAASQAYLDTWPDGPDAPRIALSLADLAARQNQPQRELQRLEAYQRTYARTPDAWLAAQHRIARVMERSGNRAGAKQAYDQGLEHWKRNRAQVKEQGMPVVAEASLRELEPAFAEYRRLDLNVGQKFLQGQLQIKGAKLKKLEEQYTAVVKMGVADPAVCALERIGRLYENFARVFLDAPVPREVRARADLMEEYQSQLAEQAEPLQRKALEGLELALQKARELGVRNECVERAQATVAAQKPELGQASEPLPALVREGQGARPEAQAARPEGYGLLAAVQAAAGAPRPRPSGAADPALPALRKPVAGQGARPAATPAAQPSSQPLRPAVEDVLPRPKKGDDEDLLP